MADSQSPSSLHFKRKLINSFTLESLWFQREDQGGSRGRIRGPRTWNIYLTSLCQLCSATSIIMPYRSISINMPYRSLWKSQCISLTSSTRVYVAIVESAPVCGCEELAVKIQINGKLNIFGREFLRNRPKMNIKCGDLWAVHTMRTSVSALDFSFYS